jgi:hypothetical protein
MVGDRIFLLSPARCSGKRASYLFREEADFEVACRLRVGEATLAEVFTFMSGLYFRGKVAYARAFGHRADGGYSALVIVPGKGLLPLDVIVTLRQLRAVSAIPVDLRDDRYSRPLLRDVRRLHLSLASDARVVLLGSIATKKYIQPLTQVLGDRLHYPMEFEGIGDMSRGALMLRQSRAEQELHYVRCQREAMRARSSRRMELPVPLA